jgi:hypothetical protein
MCCDAAFFAACLLVPYYLLVALIRWLGSGVAAMRRLVRLSHFPIGCVSRRNVAVGPVAGIADRVRWLRTRAGVRSAAVDRSVAAAGPLELPEDAVIIPYDPAQGDEGLKNATKVLVPYAKYVELWNRAYPDKRLDSKPPIVPYALAGAAYQATLAAATSWNCRAGWMSRCFPTSPCRSRLELRGAVLAGARVDGQPAAVADRSSNRRKCLSHLFPSLATPPAQMEQQARQQAVVSPEKPEPLVLLHVMGQGMKRLELTVRIKLERRGGWRVAVARVPVAPAASLSLAVPSARTEVRLIGLADRGDYETETDNARIDTALPMTGDLNLQWRPKVAEGQVDRSLTAESEAVLDVQEDGLRLTWRVNPALSAQPP